MRLSPKAFVCTVAALAGAIALAAPASPALGYTFTLGLSGPSTGVVGQPMIIRATGVNPTPSEYWFNSWLSVDAIPASVLSTCPASYGDASQAAPQAGGHILTISLRESVDATGRFSNIVGFTPRAPGRWLICGYTDDGYTNTLARASHFVDVRSVGSPATAGARPANTKAPGVRRSRNRLVCDPGRWSNRARYSYRWFMSGTRKRIATGRKLRVTRRLRGRKVRCSVRASNAAGATSASSRPVRVR